jgi:hypothetical protein
MLAMVASSSRPAQASPDPEVLFSQTTLCIRPDSDRGWRPCVGRMADALSYRDFYLIAGRPELAEQDEGRWRRRQWLIASGIGLTLLGGLSLLPALVAGKNVVPVPLSIAAMAGGLTVGILGSHTSQEPVLDAGAAADLARAYNLRLRNRLGLPPLGSQQVMLGAGVRGTF